MWQKFMCMCTWLTCICYYKELFRRYFLQKVAAYSVVIWMSMTFVWDFYIAIICLLNIFVHCFLDCQGAPSVPNAVHSTNITTFNTTVYYSCETGFLNSGSPNYVTCQADGNWTDFSYNCSKAGEQLQVIINGPSQFLFSTGWPSGLLVRFPLDCPSVNQSDCPPVTHQFYGRLSSIDKCNFISFCICLYIIQIKPDFFGFDLLLRYLLSFVQNWYSRNVVCYCLWHINLKFGFEFFWQNTDQVRFLSGLSLFNMNCFPPSKLIFAYFSLSHFDLFIWYLITRSLSSVRLR